MGNPFEQPEQPEQALPDNTNEGERRPDVLAPKFEAELQRLNAIVLSGDIVKDTRAVLEAQGFIPPDADQLLKQGDKEAIRQSNQEWVEGINLYLSGAGAHDHSVAPLLNSPSEKIMLAKKKELIEQIINSAKG